MGTDAMIVKSLGVLSVGKFLACFYALLGVIVGGFLSLFALLGAGVEGANIGPGGALLFGAGAIIIVPVAYGVAGFIGGVFVAALYNVVATIAGGIELELKPTPGESPRVDA